jgi:guanylate kinase
MIGRLVIFSGPSGVGKDTLLDKWIAADPRVRRVITYTTRAPREGEADGVDYHFVDEAEFRRMAAGGAFLEWKEVHGNLYASPVAETDALLAAGKIAVLKIDAQGALEVMAQRPDAETVFILPPSFEELERRMRFRGKDSEEDLQRRLENARWELAQADRYRLRVVNDDLCGAVAELERIAASDHGGSL